MTLFKRMTFFALVNLGIIVMLSIILNVLGIKPYLSAQGIDYSSLFIFCLVWGTGGAFISLWISKWMAKTIYGVKVLSMTGPQGHLVMKVHELAKAAGLSSMPEVGIYESPDINAFATGPSKNNSMVAVSTGLLNRMDQNEIEGVLGHEVSHIANGDMVTMTLIQGIMNAFVMFFARIAAFLLDSALRKDNDRGGGLGFFGHIMAVFFFEIVFGLIGTMIVAFFSRLREFRADKGSADLVGKPKMIAALEALKRNYHVMQESTKENKALAALQISNKSKFIALLSTHPDLDRRIAALKN